MVPDPDGQGRGDRTGEVLAVRDGRALVLFTPETGRTHQIRVHAASGLGIPIVGDPVYGAGKGPMLLHALSLRCERDGKPRDRGDRAAAADLRRGGIRRCRTLRFPKRRWTESFLAASGPGGQNVNKVATACQLRCDVFRLGLAPDVYARLKKLAGSRMTGGGEIVITARKYRTQEANREDARARLAELIAKAHVRPAKRVKTKPSRAAKAKTGRRQEAARLGQAGARQGEDGLNEP